METSIFSAEGRITRTTYWSRIIVLTGVNTVNLFVAGHDKSVQILYLLIGLVVAVLAILQGIKRMHDVDKSGWYILVPVYNIVLAFTAGTRGKNQYGDDPKSEPTGEDELLNAMMTLLISGFLTCVVYGLLAMTKTFDAMHISEPVKKSVFLLTFALLSLLSLCWDYLKRGEEEVEESPAGNGAPAKA